MREAWPTPAVLGLAVMPSESFTVHRASRMDEAGKSNGAGGGACSMSNSKRCDPRCITTLCRSCSPHSGTGYFNCPASSQRSSLRLFTSHLKQTRVRHRLGYVTCSVTVRTNTDRVSLGQVMPNVHQQPSRGINTLDHCYTWFKDGYKPVLQLIPDARDEKGKVLDRPI